MNKEFSSKLHQIFLTLIIITGSLLYSGPSKAQFHTGLIWSYSFLDYDDEVYRGVGPDGTGFGLNFGYQPGDSSLEVALRLMTLDSSFLYQNIHFDYKVKFYSFLISYRTSVWVPFFHFKIGMGFHKFETTLNNSELPWDEFSRYVFDQTHGSSPSFFLGPGIKIPLGDVAFSTVDFLFHKFSKTTLYDIQLTLNYVF